MIHSIYLELARDPRWQRKIDHLRQELEESMARANIAYDWSGVEYIRSKEELLDWKNQIIRRTSDCGRRRVQGPREVLGLIHSEHPVRWRRRRWPRRWRPGRWRTEPDVRQRLWNMEG